MFAIGAERFNPSDRDADFTQLLQRLALFKGPRESLGAHIDIAFD